MFSNKVPNTVFNRKPNLKSAIIIKNILNNNKFFRNDFTNLLEITNMCKHARDKLKEIFKNKFLSLPRSLKHQSPESLRIWAHQCECVIAQRLRRGQQMFSLYTKLWEERALRELLSRMRYQITRHGKELMLSAVGVASFNWDKNRIQKEEIAKHVDELEYIHLLTEKTIICECPKHTESFKKTFAVCGCEKTKTNRKIYDNWEPFIERKDMLVWRKPHGPGQYEYKVYGSYNDVTAEDFLNVQIDINYRKIWDKTAVVLRIIEKDPLAQSNSDIIYWEMQWPKLFANRDYVYTRRFMVDYKKNTIVILSRGTQHPECPVRSDKYRIQDYWSNMVIRPYTDLNKPGIEFGLTYFDNPGVNLPSSVTNWVTTRAMPDFLTNLREASRGYKSYCERIGNKSVFSVYPVRQDFEEEPDDWLEDITIHNTVYEPEHPLVLRHKSTSRSKRKKTVEDEEKLSETKSAPTTSSDSEVPAQPTPTSLPIVQAPSSPMVHAHTERRTYWKYFQPNYYFS